MAFSFAPSDAVHGGLPSNIDVRITSAKCQIYTYPKSGEQATALIIEYTPLDGSSKFDQVYSAGNPGRIVPTDDEESFEAANSDISQESLNDSSNLYVFMKELVAHDYPEAKLRDFKASSLVGLEAHVVRKAQPKKEGALPGDKPQEVLVVSKIITLPWEKSKVTKATKSTKAADTPAAAAAPAAEASSNGSGAAPDSPHSAAVAAAVLDLLVKAPENTLPMVNVAKGLFTALPNLKVAEKTAASKLIYSEPWRTANIPNVVMEGSSLVLLG
jgi:hypothetical protein